MATGPLEEGSSTTRHTGLRDLRAAGRSLAEALQLAFWVPSAGSRSQGREREVMGLSSKEADLRR